MAAPAVPAAPPAPICDDSHNIVALMPRLHYLGYARNFPNQVVAGPGAHHCVVGRGVCQNREINNDCHPVPAGAPMLAGAPTTRDRTVCDECDEQACQMAMEDRLVPLPGAVPVAPVHVFVPGHENVFFQDPAMNIRSVNHGVGVRNLQQGAHHIGRLCTLCENTEIVRYWERRSGSAGGRRQTAERAGNTCECEVFLNQRLCYQDRVNYLLDVKAASQRNASTPHSWLRWLFYNPVAGRAQWATATPAPSPGATARANIWASRGPGQAINKRNACRCGREIAIWPRQYTHRDHAVRPNTPIPVAMCTACDGIVIDTAHPRVTGWSNFRRASRRAPQAPPVLPPHEQVDLMLGRPVEQV